MSSHRFGVSTHLFHDQRLDREHLVDIAAHGFECVEVFATRTHFDYHDSVAVRSLAEWLEETRLELNSLHGPITASLTGGAWGEVFSFATTDEARRQRAIAETEAALAVAQTIPYRYLVLHLGLPDSWNPGPSDNSRDAARRSLQSLGEMGGHVGVKLAIEVIPNALSHAETLVSFIESDLEGADVGICMDVGHAFIMGDVADAIETCAEHLVTTHLHDNSRKSDDHLAPGEGSIDWPATLMSLQKIGYEGAWMFEVANTSTSQTVLAKTKEARRRFDDLLSFDCNHAADVDEL
ncbi:MAG TPA: sugar phosphate isomerase/epimerase [Vicinamibacterales bacterium]|nr:sugar phosphate isomerase/epimerase [Vicinamibacterales bacterium]